MRSDGDDAGHRASAAAGINQRDRPAVAMPDEERLLDRQRIQELRQRSQRFVVHVTDAAPRSSAIGSPVAIARVDDDRTSGRLRESLRKIAPHRDRAQSLVQQDERGAIAALRARPRVFEAMASGDNEWHRTVRGQTPR